MEQTVQNEKTGKLLEVKDLRVSFFTPAGEVKAVSGISYDLDYDEVMGIVGESGSGPPARSSAAPSPSRAETCSPSARTRWQPSGAARWP